MPRHRITSQREHATWWYAVFGVVFGLVVAVSCIGCAVWKVGG